MNGKQRPVKLPDHAPEPWKAGRPIEGIGTVAIRDALGDVLGYATCAGQGYGDKQTAEQALATATLWAEAPALLTALRHLHSVHRTFSNAENWTSIDDDARAEAESIFDRLGVPT